MGYSHSNTSPLLKRFLARSDELVKKVAQTVRSPAGGEGVTDIDVRLWPVTSLTAMQ
jgi:hypothetical protein